MLKITTGQLSRFAFVYIISEPFAFFIGHLLKMSAYQGWMSLIGGYLLSLILLYFTVKLGSIEPSVSWTEFGTKIMGKWLHSCVLILVVLLCIYLISIDIENFSIFFGTMYMEKTPIQVIIILTSVCIALTARSGVTTIVYMAEGIFLLIVGSSLITVPGMFGGSHYDMLTTLQTHHDLKKAAVDSLSTLPWFSEWFLLIFLAPQAFFGRKTLRSLMIYGFLVTVMVMTFWLLCLLNFGPYLGGDLRYPVLEVIRLARYGDFLDNLDPFLIAFWSTTMFIRSSFLLYVASICLSHVARLQDYGSTSFILGITAATFAIQYSYKTDVYEKATYSYELSVFLVLVECIPILYVFIYRIRFGKINKLKT